MPQAPSDAPDEFLVAFLADRDVPCPSCGYNVRGLRARRCPECNEPLELRVGVSDERWAPYVTGVAGCAAGAAFCAMVEAYALVRFGGLSRGESIPLVGGLAASLALLGAWIWSRRRVRRMKGARAWSLAIIVCVLALTGAVSFLVTV